MSNNVSITYILLLHAILPLLAILSLDITSIQPITAQLDDNSPSIEEEEIHPFDTMDGIYGLVLVITIIPTAIRADNPKARRRVWIAFSLLFISFLVWMIAHSPTLDLSSLRILAIFLGIIAFIIVVIPHRTHEPILWKQHTGVRRYFAAQVRDQVLKAQIQVCKL